MVMASLFYNVIFSARYSQNLHAYIDLLCYLLDTKYIIYLENKIKN